MKAIIKTSVLIIIMNLLAACDSSENAIKPPQDVKDTSSQIVSEESIGLAGCVFEEEGEKLSCEKEQDSYADYTQFVAVVDYYRKLEAKRAELDAETSLKSAQEEYNHLIISKKSLKVYAYIFGEEIEGKNYRFFKSKKDFAAVSDQNEITQEMYTKETWSQIKRLYLHTGIRFEYKNKTLQFVLESVPTASETLNAYLEAAINTLQVEKMPESLPAESEAYELRLQYVTWLQIILEGKL